MQQTCVEDHCLVLWPMKRAGKSVSDCELLLGFGDFYARNELRCALFWTSRFDAPSVVCGNVTGETCKLNFRRQSMNPANPTSLHEKLQHDMDHETPHNDYCRFATMAHCGTITTDE